MTKSGFEGFPDSRENVNEAVVKQKVRNPCPLFLKKRLTSWQALPKHIAYVPSGCVQMKFSGPDFKDLNRAV